MPLIEDQITVHLGPQEQNGPDSLIDPIVDFIDGVRRRRKLMIAVQEIDHRPIAHAIIRARQRGVTRNLNHVVVINDAEVANAFKREFREIQRGRFGKFSIDHDDKPTFATVSDMRVKILFAPDHSPEMEITKQINKACNRIDLAVFTFSQSSGIDDALIAATLRGVQINALLDNKQANQRWAASHSLRRAGINVVVAGNRDGLGKLHHKLITIDDRLSIFGSFNYTGPANKTNDENIAIIDDLNERDTQIRASQRSIARAARNEIHRIINQFGRRF